MPNSTLGIDFDAILTEEFTFKRNGKTFVARDDVPFEKIVAAAIAMAQLETLSSLPIETVSDIETAIDHRRRDIIHACADIFRDRDPDITDDEIGTTFGLNGCVEIIRFFSARIGTWSSQQQNATPSTKPTPKRHK